VYASIARLKAPFGHLQAFGEWMYETPDARSDVPVQIDQDSVGHVRPPP